MPALEQYYQLGNYIDTWAPGFSARVARATHWQSGQDVAFKVLRREHLEDPRVWLQFVSEVTLLELLRHTDTINQMVDCGFVSDLSHERPSGGEILPCGRDAKAFRQELLSLPLLGWRPYIALELLPAEHSLLNLVRGAEGNGLRPLRLPTNEGLALAIQFTEFLREAHRLNVVYWDHKPEHVFWDGQRMRLIDLNVSRVVDPGLSPESGAAEMRKDLRQMVAAVLYTAFTGRDFRFQDRLPEAAPSSPNSVERRFNEVHPLNFGMDDTLLPDLIELLNEVMGNGTARVIANTLLDRLHRLAAMLGWEGYGYSVTEEAGSAQQEVQRGLAELREAQALVNRARGRFLNAHTLNPIDRDSERLYRDASDFYQRRVLP